MSSRNAFPPERRCVIIHRLPRRISIGRSLHFNKTRKSMQNLVIVPCLISKDFLKPAWNLLQWNLLETCLKRCIQGLQHLQAFVWWLATILPSSHKQVCECGGFKRAYLVQYSTYSSRICCSYYMAQSLSSYRIYKFNFRMRGNSSRKYVCARRLLMNRIEWFSIECIKTNVITLANHNRRKQYRHVTGAKRGKTRTTKSRLLLVWHLIG